MITRLLMLSSLLFYILFRIIFIALVSVSFVIVFAIIFIIIVFVLLSLFSLFIYSLLLLENTDNYHFYFEKKMFVIFALCRETPTIYRASFTTFSHVPAQGNGPFVFMPL